MARKTRRQAVMVDCPGIVNEGRYAHAMRDGCWSCAPFWERVPTCPDDRKKLTPSGFCRTCRQHYTIPEEAA